MLSSIILAAIQILFFAVIIYTVFRFLRHTPGIRVLVTLGIILSLVAMIAYFCHLEAISRSMLFILKWIMPVAVVILFQQDLRRWLIIISNVTNNSHLRRLWRRNNQKKRRNADLAINELVNTACSLSARPEWRNYLRSPGNPSPIPNIHLPLQHTGALIAITGEHGLKEYAEQGEQFTSAINCLLLRSIFNHGSPLHDGGVIINEKFHIEAAGCRFPSSLHGRLEPVHTRHNAALGLAEVTDALVILVSEESGLVSIAKDSALVKMETPQKLVRALKQHFGIDAEETESEETPSFLERIIIYIADALGASI